MKKISLSQGLFTQVSDEDFEALNEFKWYAQKRWNTFYAVRSIRLENGKRTTIRMHREILCLTDSKIQGDHQDRNGLNNQRDNLRIATNQQNQWNRNAKGYSLHEASQKFQAYIRLNGNRKHLGCFKTELEAHKAYLEAKKIYHVYANNK